MNGVVMGTYQNFWPREKLIARTLPLAQKDKGEIGLAFFGPCVARRSPRRVRTPGIKARRRRPRRPSAIPTDSPV